MEFAEKFLENSNWTANNKEQSAMANRLQRILNPLSEHQKEQRRDLGLPSQRRVDRLNPSSNPNSPSHSPSRPPAPRDRASAPASTHSPLAPSSYARTNYSEYNNFYALASSSAVTKDEIAMLVSLQLDARFKAVGDALAETVAAEDAHDEEVLRRLELVFERLGLVERRLSVLSLRENQQQTEQLHKQIEHLDPSANSKTKNALSPELEVAVVGVSRRTKNNIDGPLNSVNSAAPSKISSADISVILERLDSIDSTLAFTSSRIDALEAKLVDSTSSADSHSHTNSPSDIINSNLPHPRRVSSGTATPGSPTSTKASFRLSSTLTAIPNLGISNSLAKLSHFASLSRPSSRNSNTGSVSAAAAVAAALAAETSPVPQAGSDSVVYTPVAAHIVAQKSLKSSNSGSTLNEAH
ncbi:hypothetical protein HK100_009704 [Physocladia obscura]|uniref:Uncharacterized protein n=1 Tax=Physocladia obscura TaxID=109957 RepID=A0AAD5T475_9FUNG|nr:hypothetical protein HK100_009704 [Physocladia obscura]